MATGALDRARGGFLGKDDTMTGDDFIAWHFVNLTRPEQAIALLLELTDDAKLPDDLRLSDAHWYAVLFAADNMTLALDRARRIVAEACAPWFDGTGELVTLHRGECPSKAAPTCRKCGDTGWLHGAQRWTPGRMSKGTPYYSEPCECNLSTESST